MYTTDHNWCQKFSNARFFCVSISIRMRVMDIHGVLGAIITQTQHKYSTHWPLLETAQHSYSWIPIWNMAGKLVICPGHGVASGGISSVEYLQGESAKIKTRAKESGDRLPQVSVSHTRPSPELLMRRLWGAQLTVLRATPCWSGSIRARCIGLSSIGSVQHQKMYCRHILNTNITYINEVFKCITATSAGMFSPQHNLY